MSKKSQRAYQPRHLGSSRVLNRLQRQRPHSGLRPFICNPASDGFSMLKHELRTPLSGILGMTSMLQDTITGMEHKQLLKSLEQSGRQLENLVSRIGPSRTAAIQGLDARPEISDGLILMQHLVQAHWPSAKDKGIDLYLLFDHRLSSDWFVNAVALRQVLDNLLTNAIKFTGEGYILVEARLPKDRCSKAGDLEILVSDTGMGIADSDCQRVYSVNEQGINVSGQGYGGSGLGLYICTRLLAGLGGTLEHTPADGKGCTFRLLLPKILTSKPASSKRLTPALLTQLNCLLGVRDPVYRVMACLLERIGVSYAELSETGVNKPPADMQTVICHADRLHLPGQDGYLCGNSDRLLIISPSRRSAGAVRSSPGAIQVKALPLPILMSNFEPLLLGVALNQQMAGKYSDCPD
jgi:nitrogen-specific signal transduction histidine kinase